MKKYKIALTAIISGLISISFASTVNADINGYASWKQSGESWSSDIIGTSGETISAVGCKIVSTAIQLVRSGAVTDDSFNPGVLNSYFSSHGGYNGSGMTFTAADGYNGSDFSYEGSLKLTDVYLSDHMDELINYYDSGYYMVMGVSYSHSRYDTNHWVAIEKYDASQNRWYMNDPAAGTQDDPFNFSKYTPNCVHVYSCSSKPFDGVKVSSSEIKEAADSVKEQNGKLTENTHRLSEYSDSQKATLAILENKTINDAEYEAFKWNMIVSQFNIPYCESIPDTLKNNSAWSKFFSDGLRFNSNAYLNSMDSYISDTDKIELENYVTELRKDITTPIVKTVTSSGSTSESTDISNKTITIDENFVDNKWAAFLVNPYEPAYDNTLECKAILDQLSQDSSIGSVVSESYNKNPNAEKTFISMNSSLKKAPGIDKDTTEIDCGGKVSKYANGKIAEIPQSFLNAMIKDMHSSSECASSEFGEITKNTGMGYRTFYQATYGDGDSLIANLENNLWGRTLGMFSEHCTGTAVDFQLSYDSLTNQTSGINNSTGDSKANKEFNWLADNAYKYGFIWRYKTSGEKTGTIYEGWHWRFVGVHHATEFWKKCSSDGVNGYDINDDYTWEDYYKENIKTDSSYPKSYYDAIVNIYKEDETKCTYDEYKSGSININSIDSNALSNTDVTVESSLTLQAYELLKKSDSLHSDVYNTDEQLATIEDLLNGKYLFIKDTIAVAGKELVYTDNVEIDLPTLSLAENNSDKADVDDNSLVKNLWDSLKDFGTVSNGTVQGVWDSVLEANHNQTIEIPVYINSDISTMYNTLFISNAIRKCGYGDYQSFISTFKGCTLSTDSYGNICVNKSGKYYVVYPAYANTLFTEIDNDNVIGKVFQSITGTDLIKSSLNTMIENNVSDNGMYISGVEKFVECMLKEEYVQDITYDEDNLVTNAIPTILRVDSENTFINNKLFLSLYSNKYEPNNSSSWYDTLVERRNKYKEYDLENYSKLYNNLSQDSKFNNSIILNQYNSSFINNSCKLTNGMIFNGKNYSNPVNIYDSYRRNQYTPFTSSYIGGIFNIFFNPMDRMFSHPICELWNEVYNFSYNDYCWLETNGNSGDSFTGSIYNLASTKSTDSNKYMYSVPINANCLMDSESMKAFDKRDNSQNADNGSAVYGSTYFKTNKVVSDAIENYPIEDIIYVSYIWNKEILSKMDITNISLLENNLDKVFYSDNLINTTNILSESNNKTIYFTRSIDSNENIVFLKDGENRYVFKSDCKLYSVNYNLPLLMLGVNKNAYGDNLDYMISKLQSGVDAEISILDKMWEISTHTSSSFKFLFLSGCQIIHNKLVDTGLGNPFIMTTLYKKIVDYKIYMFVLIGILVCIGIVKYTLDYVRSHSSVKGIGLNISKVITTSLIPILLIIFIANLVNGMSSVLINDISTDATILNLEQTKRKDNIIDDDDAIFYDVIKDADKGFYSMSVKLPGDEKSTNLYKLYTDVSFDTWYSDNSQTMPWYSNKEFIPVHYSMYDNSVFYYFYDYLTYQYLGYENKLGGDSVKEVTRKFILPEVTDKYNYQSYKNSCKVSNKQYMSLRDNVLKLYKSKNYSYITIDDKDYVKDLLGLSNMFNMCDSSDLLYKSPDNSYFNGDIYEWSKQVNDNYLSDNLFTGYINGTHKKCYPIAKMLSGKQGEVFNNLDSLVKHNMSDNSLIKFTPTYLNKELKDEYETLGYELDRNKYYPTLSNQRAPWKIYASKGILFKQVSLSEENYTGKFSELEEKLNEINNNFITDIEKLNISDVSDNTMIFALALNATFKFNNGLDNTLDSVATPKGISPDGLTSDTLSKCLYLNNVKDVTGYNFTYALYKKYSIITVISVIVQEVLLFVASICKIVLVVLLLFGSLRLILTTFLSKGEIKTLIASTIRQLVICVFCHGFIIFTIIFSMKILSVYTNMALIVSFISSLLYIIIIEWTVLQIKSMVKEFKTMGANMIKLRLSEISNAFDMSVKKSHSQRVKFSNMMIHKTQSKAESNARLNNQINNDIKNLSKLDKGGDLNK